MDWDLQYAQDFGDVFPHEAAAEVVAVHQAEGFKVDLDVVAVGDLDNVGGRRRRVGLELGGEEAAVGGEDLAVEGEGNGEAVLGGEGELDVARRRVVEPPAGAVAPQYLRHPLLPELLQVPERRLGHRRRTVEHRVLLARHHLEQRGARPRLVDGRGRQCRRRRGHGVQEAGGEGVVEAGVVHVAATPGAVGEDGRRLGLGLVLRGGEMAGAPTFVFVVFTVNTCQKNQLVACWWEQQRS